jgi:hypothetical protein
VSVNECRQTEQYNVMVNSWVVSACATISDAIDGVSHKPMSLLLYSGHIIDTCCVFLDKLITFIYIYIVLYKISAYFKLRVTCLFND